MYYLRFSVETDRDNYITDFCHLAEHGIIDEIEYRRASLEDHHFDPIPNEKSRVVYMKRDDIETLEHDSEDFMFNWRDYKVEDNNLICPDPTYPFKTKMEREYKRLARMEEIKQLLSKTDYMVIKNMEASLTGALLPYTDDSIFAERQALRDEYNKLEKDV